MQFIILVISFVGGVAFSKMLYTKPAQKFHKVGHHKGYHLHHSLYGIMAFILIPFFSFISILLIGLGLGIIFHHTKREGLIFITKD